MAQSQQSGDNASDPTRSTSELQQAIDVLEVVESILTTVLVVAAVAGFYIGAFSFQWTAIALLVVVYVEVSDV